jgi:hypothetical protein
MKRKKDNIKRIIWLGLIIIAFGFILGEQYKFTQISKGDLSYVEMTFDHFEEGPNSKSKKRNIIYSAEGVAFGFGSIVDVNKQLLYGLNKGSKVDIYYIKANDSYYRFEIIEMYYNDRAIMTVDDYHEDYADQLKLSVLVIIGFILFISFFTFVFPKLFNKVYDRIYDKKYGLEKIDFTSKKAKAKYKAFAEAISFDGKRHHADFTNSFDEGNFDIQVLCKYLYDEMDSQEIRLIYEDTAIDEIAYLAFKYNGKILFEAAFIDKEGKMEIDELLIAWTYPEYSEFNEFERKMFYQSIERFSKMQGIEFIFSNEDNRLIENRSKKK